MPHLILRNQQENNINLLFFTFPEILTTRNGISIMFHLLKDAHDDMKLN